MTIDRSKQTAERVAHLIAHLNMLKRIKDQRIKDQMEREEQLRTGRFRNGLDAWMQYNERRVSDRRTAKMAATTKEQRDYAHSRKREVFNELIARCKQAQKPIGG